MKQYITFPACFLTLLCGCTLRYSPLAVYSLQKKYAESAPSTYTFLETPSEKTGRGAMRAAFLYDPVLNPFPVPGKPGDPRLGSRASLLKPTAIRAITAAFRDEGVTFKKGYVLKIKNAAVTLDGYNEQLNAGFIFITNREMLMSPMGCYMTGPEYVDPDEVAAVQAVAPKVLIISNADRRFTFEAGLDTSKPALEIEGLTANRNAALGRLYSTVRTWIRIAKIKEKSP